MLFLSSEQNSTENMYLELIVFYAKLKEFDSL